MLRSVIALSVIGSVAVAVPPQPPADSGQNPRVVNPSSELTAQSLKATGFEFEQAFRDLYSGRFARMAFRRDQFEFSVLMGSYLRIFGKRCPDQLPRNRVEMTEDKCVRWLETRNGYNILVDSTCTATQPVGIGIFADPQVYTAYRSLTQASSGTALGEALSIMRGGLGGIAAMSQSVRSLSSDMSELITANGCSSRALAHFQENMRRYASNDAPIVITGTDNTQVPRPTTDDRVNYTKLLDDFVGSASTTWTFNRYLRGSMAKVRLASHDAQGRPRRITGSYTYEGFAGRQTGTVALEFANGVPSCLYFWDFPNDCRTPESHIVAEYEKGKYSARE
jgi:hypothetical protein